MKKEYHELGIEHNIECLSSRRKRNLIGYMYYQGMEEMNFVKTRCDRILRSNKKALMKYNFSNLTKLHESPFYRGVKLWNKLPENVQKCKQRDKFKKMVKNLDVQNI